MVDVQDRLIVSAPEHKKLTEEHTAMLALLKDIASAYDSVLGSSSAGTAATIGRAKKFLVYRGEMLP
jgi:hypothetical protein